MLLPIKAICSKSKIRKDGTSLVFLQYCATENKRTLLNTNIAVPPKCWNRRLRRITCELPEQYGLYSTLNEQIALLIRKAEDITSFGIKNNVDDILGFVKANFSPDFDTSTLEGNESLNIVFDKMPLINLDFYVQFDDYMKIKKNKVTPGMMNVYKNTKDVLSAFDMFRSAKITFECLDYNFYDRLVDFLTYDYEQRRRKEEMKGLKQSTIGKIIKQLRIFLKDRIRRKIIAPIDLTDFKILDEEADAIYLTPSEIENIYLLDLSKRPNLALYRDLLVLGCLTGLRFSDFSSIKSEDIKGDMLYKKQRKSDSWVVIPLRPHAYKILVDRFKGDIPKTTNAEFNRHIKTVGKLAGITEFVKFSYKRGNQDVEVKKSKSEWITSHTCRRSFCTNEYLAGTPVELIMKISGHKSLKDFYKYIRITPEEAGNKIKELWKKREMEVSA